MLLYFSVFNYSARKDKSSSNLVPMFICPTLLPQLSILSFYYSLKLIIVSNQILNSFLTAYFLGIFITIGQVFPGAFSPVTYYSFHWHLFSRHTFYVSLVTQNIICYSIKIYFSRNKSDGTYLSSVNLKLFFTLTFFKFANKKGTPLDLCVTFVT